LELGRQMDGRFELIRANRRNLWLGEKKAVDSKPAATVTAFVTVGSSFKPPCKFENM